MGIPTQGPWVAAAGPSSIVGWPVVAQTGRLICNIATPPKDINRVGKAAAEYEAFMAECEANARQIAAAPDMFEALREAYDFLSANYQNLSTGNWHDDDAALVAGNVLAAIAKAEGQSTRRDGPVLREGVA